MKTIDWVSDRNDEKRTQKPPVALVIKVGTPIVNNNGTMTSPPPIPVIEAKTPATIAFLTSCEAIFGVMVKPPAPDLNPILVFWSNSFFRDFMTNAEIE